MEMSFFWITNQVILGEFDVQCHPGHKILVYYYTKHFDGKHHMEVCPCYLHGNNSPRLLSRAEAPSSFRECVGSLPNGYIRLAPLLQKPIGKT